MLIGMGDKSVRISVRGEHTERAAPQRVVVHAGVTLDGPEARSVHDAVANTAVTLRTSIEALVVGGSATEFSVDQVRLSSSRPWNSEGAQLPLVHQATVDLTVTFTDFAVLTAWAAEHADTAGFVVRHLDWQLTDETRAELERRCRQAAYDDARRRAEDYAAAAGLGDLRVRRIDDDQTIAVPVFAMAAAKSADGVELSPRALEVTVNIGVDFDAARSQ